MPKSYKQYCALANALDVIGDRWTILILRNLILGPQRYGELRRDLPGIATNLLANRLRDMEGNALIEVDEEFYRLSDLGVTLIPVLFTISDWGERHVLGMPDGTQEMRLRYAMTSVYRRMQPTEVENTLQMRIGDDVFSLVTGHEPYVEAVERTDADATIQTEVPAAIRLLFRGESLKRLIDENVVLFGGSRKAANAVLKTIAPIARSRS